MLAHCQPKFKQVKCVLHPDQNYAFLCLDADCEERGVVCAECLLFKHSEHTSKPLSLALGEVANDLLPLPGSLIQVVKIDQVYARFHNAVQRLPRDRRGLTEEIERFFKHIHDRLRDYQSICKQILTCERLGKQFNQLIKRYKFYERENEEEKSKTNYQFYLEEILHFVSDRLQEFEQAMTKRLELNQLLEILVPFESQTKVAYRFSQTLKHTSITITMDGVTASQQHNYSTNFALIEPALEGKRSLKSKRSIKLQINKLSSWLSIGVVYLAIAQKANFYFNTGGVGHGGFMLSYNGYSWHNSDTSLNSNYITFNFAQGDTVIITINPASKRIIFEKEGQQQNFELPYQRVVGDQLYFCVSLSNHDESVSIVK